MSDTRREFLANCLGGAATVALTQGLAAQPAAAAEPTAPVFQSAQDLITHANFWTTAHRALPVDLPMMIDVETDLNPINTKVKWLDRPHSPSFIQGMQLQRTPSGKYLAGLSMCVSLPDDGQPLGFQLQPLGFQLRTRSATHGQSPMYLFDMQTVSDVPGYVVGCTVNPNDMLATAFLLTTASLQLSKLDVKFHRCPLCAFHEQVVSYETGVSGWTVMERDGDKHWCDKCRQCVVHDTLQMTEADISRIYINTESAYVLFRDQKAAEVEPRRFTPDTHGGAEFIFADLGNPLARVYPVSGYTWDVFSKALFQQR